MTELSIWVKPDKTEIKLNSEPATEVKALSMGWKKKGTRKVKAVADVSKDAD